MIIEIVPMARFRLWSGGRRWRYGSTFVGLAFQREWRDAAVEGVTVLTLHSKRAPGE